MARCPIIWRDPLLTYCGACLAVIRFELRVALARNLPRGVSLSQDVVACLAVLGALVPHLAQDARNAPKFK